MTITLRLLTAAILAMGLTLSVTTIPAEAHTSSPGAVPASKYRGKYYDARYESIRKCIVHRESRGHYRVVNRYSGAAGAYQFMPSTSNTVARWIKKWGRVGRPANTWSRKGQDRAFWRLLNHGRGLNHWAGGSYRCW